MSDVPAPFRGHRTRVRPEWVDYNGHMHDAWYAVVLSDANEHFCDVLGLSADYRASTGAALYTVEMHLRFLAECAQGEELTATTVVLDADAKRLRLHTEIASDSGPVATGEALYLHVDGTSGRVVPMPADREEQVSAWRDRHAALPRPAHVGLGVAAARSRR